MRALHSCPSFKGLCPSFKGLCNLLQDVRLSSTMLVGGWVGEGEGKRLGEV